jgi:hypothetical protein
MSDTAKRIGTKLFGRTLGTGYHKKCDCFHKLHSGQCNQDVPLSVDEANLRRDGFGHLVEEKFCKNCMSNHRNS